MSQSAAAPVNRQDQINQRLYQHAALVRTYQTSRLFPAEAVAMIRYSDHIAQGRVLDLGCGAGRLATYLLPLAAEYVGVDISERMVRHCRAAFPSLRFETGELRDLSVFPDEAFDAILAVSNLIDAVSHAHRLTTLAEIRRILAPGGGVIFSSHNRDYVRAGESPRLEFHRNPLKQLRLLADYWRSYANHRRIKPFQRNEPEYALVNDSGNDYCTLHYYISHETQVRQLETAGYELIECLDQAGQTLSPGDPGRASSSLTYLARRPR
jgi:SAM-dependent methyltransferase